MRKRNLLRLLTAILFFAVITPGVFANGQKEKTSDSEKITESKAISNKPIEFTMLYSDNASYGYKKDWITLQKMTELTNVTLKIQPVPEADYTTKRRIVLNSGNIPDIVSKTLASEVTDYAASGILLPINKYLDKMPNLSRTIKEFGLEDDLRNITEEDGNWYQLPVRVQKERIQNQTWLYRSDLLEKHNIEVPQTMEDVYTAAKKLKSIYPDSYPITNRFTADNVLSVIAPSFGTRAGWGLTSGGYWFDPEKKEWIFAPTSVEFKNLLQWFNKMLKEGLLDPEFATLDSNVYEQKIMTGKTFFMLDWLGNEKRYYATARKEDPDFTITAMLPPKGPDGDRGVRQANKFAMGWVIPARVANEKYFDRLLQFIDWFYTDDAVELFAWGVEGVTFKTDADGSKHYLPQVLSGEFDPTKETGTLNNVFNVVYDMDAYMDFQSKEAQAAFKEMAKENVVPAFDPKLLPTADEREEMKMIQSSLDNYFKQKTEEFIFGKESFSNWEAYEKECQNKGSAKLGEMINTIWKRQNNK